MRCAAASHPLARVAGVDALWSGSIDGWSEPAPVSDPRAAARTGERRRRRPHLAEPEAGPAELSGKRRADGALGRGRRRTTTAEAAGAQSALESRAAAEEDVDGRVASPPAPLPVEVIRSSKRQRTVGARIVDGRIVVRVPHRLTATETDEAVAALVDRLERRRTSTQVDLSERARVLAARYGLPEPDRIRWVGNQQGRWGSCTPASRDIRISDRIAGFPTWVVDAVIVHELAHLVHADHSAAFWALAGRFPKTERALGFLIAKDLTEEEPA